MQPITVTHLEHHTAPRLEHDIHTLFLNIRYQRGEKYDTDYWLHRLSGYIQEWSLLFITNEFYYGFWLEIFMGCYRASKFELNILGVKDEAQVQNLVGLILIKLEKIFQGAEILEEIKRKNEKHLKQIERYQKEYDQVTEYCFDLNKINVVCAYRSDTACHISILDMNKHIQIFNKHLKLKKYFPMQYLYWYRRVVRIPEKNQYVMVLSLTVNARIYTDTSFYLDRLKELWQFATGYEGIVIDLLDDDSQSHELVSQIFTEFDDQDDVTSLLERDVVNTDESSKSVRIWPIGFKHFIGTSGKNI